MTWQQFMAGAKDVQVFVMILCYLAGTIGGLWCIVTYKHAKIKEQESNYWKTYDDLDERYLGFQRLCLEFPHLDVFDLPNPTSVKLNDQEKRQELIAFNYLFGVFERAYIMYNHASTPDCVRKWQWSGWEEMMRRYSQRQNFRDAWKSGVATLDTRFHAFMDAMLRETEVPARDLSPASALVATK